MDCKYYQNGCHTVVPLVKTKQIYNVTWYIHTYMQVQWLGMEVEDCTWEPIASLPSQMVSDYEAGIRYEVEETSVAAAGQTIHTLATVTKSEEPPQKKQRGEITPSSKG